MGFLILAFPLGALAIISVLSQREMELQAHQNSSAIQKSAAVQAEIQALTTAPATAQSVAASLSRLERLVSGDLDQLERIHRISALAGCGKRLRPPRVAGETACPTTDNQWFTSLGGAGIQPAGDFFRSLLGDHGPGIRAEIAGLQEADARNLAQAMAARSKSVQSKNEASVELGMGVGLAGGLLSLVLFFRVAANRERKSLQRISAQAEQAARELRTGISASQDSGQQDRKNTVFYRAVLNELSDGVIIADEVGNYVYWNPAAERILGRGIAFTRPAEWSQRYGLPAESALIAAIHGKASENEQIRFQTSDNGPSVYIAATTQPILHSGDRAGGAWMVFRETAQPRTQPVLIREALEEAAAMVQNDASRSNVSLRATIGPAWELQALADRDVLKQAMADLLLRAIQCNHEGGPITISCAKTPTDSLRLQIAPTRAESEALFIEIPLCAQTPGNHSGDLAALRAMLNGPSRQGSTEAAGSTMKVEHSA